MSGHLKHRGGKTWEIRIELGRGPDGKRRTRNHYVSGTKRQAQVKLHELLHAAGQGAYVAPSRLTIGDYVGDRIDHWERLGRPGRRPISRRTAERYRELNDLHIRPHLGAIELQALSTAQVEQWHATLAKEGRRDGTGGLSLRTIGHAHRVLAAALSDAEHHRAIVRNEARQQRPPKPRQEEITILTADQIKTVHDALRGKALYPLVMAALDTGIRRGELCALQWGDVDTAAKTIRVRRAVEQPRAAGITAKEPKTASGTRTIDLPEIVVAALSDLRRRQLETRMALGLGRPGDAFPVFPASPLGEMRSPRGVTKEWAKAAADMGLPDVTLHALRHTHASMLIDSGLDVVRISRRLGHASPNITLAIYAHLFRKADTASADAINAALAKLSIE